ncbi:MAG: DUF1616 domain-containing protein [Candidatus Hydrothermarchaeota archaeon]|nr:DUF1616 domain-containing protein [Candidatus Hydrothermarchaeota archaeon]
MEPLEATRAIIGLALVLFLPGFALTMALWPRSKKEVRVEVILKLKKKGIKEASIVGNGEQAEDLILAMKENGISVEVNPNEEKKKNACIVVGTLEEEHHVPEAELIIDMGNAVEGAVKVEDTIDGIERAALSFGLSVALVPILGIILDKTPYGIRMASILASLILVIALFLGVYYYRRKSFEMPISYSF